MPMALDAVCVSLSNASGNGVVCVGDTTANRIPCVAFAFAVSCAESFSSIFSGSSSAVASRHCFSRFSPCDLSESGMAGVLLEEEGEVESVDMVGECILGGSVW